jgi:hypothetical protein
LYIREITPSRRVPDGKGELVMTASNAVTSSIRLAGTDQVGGDSTAIVQNYQHKMKSNLVEKQEGIDNRK